MGTVPRKALVVVVLLAISGGALWAQGGHGPPSVRKAAQANPVAVKQEPLKP